ncbi:MAG: hypothetical protein EOO01_08955 [Chitinophagaceae bacterium]|nr:MAG: hypothetical protein EOO01_08955 [Chitinophagaceae bacterium]
MGACIIFGCDKQENTNIGFREPTCQDTTDDGVFETFTSSETAQFLDTLNVPETGVDTLIQYMQISGRELRNDQIFYEPYLRYKLSRPAEFYLYLPYKNQQEHYYAWPKQVNNIEDTVKVNIYNVRPEQLDEGCYRLYYVFVDTGASRTVLSKGHYDIEIK